MPSNMLTSLTLDLRNNLTKYNNTKWESDSRPYLKVIRTVLSIHLYYHPRQISWMIYQNSRMIVLDSDRKCFSIKGNLRITLIVLMKAQRVNFQKQIAKVPNQITIKNIILSFSIPIRLENGETCCFLEII